MKEQFMITRQGKQYVLFQGLLDEAHTQGLRGIDTDLVQVPDPENGNVAIVKAVCEMEDGRKFSGIGDASPENVGRNIAPHIIRMAETRAKARALRDAVNVGATALEELSEGDDSEAAPAGNSPAQRNQRGSGSGGPTPISRSRGTTQRSQRSEGDEARVPDGSTQAAPRAEAQAADPGEESNGQPEKPAAKKGGSRGGRGEAKARKSQVDLLKTLAVEWAGDGGVERLEKRIEKPLTDLTRSEADEWIDRLTPEGRE